jgi:hypothetical protein
MPTICLLVYLMMLDKNQVFSMRNNMMIMTTTTTTIIIIIIIIIMNVGKADLAYFKIVFQHMP